MVNMNDIQGDKLVKKKVSQKKHGGNYRGVISLLEGTSEKLVFYLNKI